MPVPVQRDPEVTRALLAAWLERGPRTDVRVGPVTVPDAVGFSAEILLCDARWNEGRSPRTERLVVRVAPSGHRLMHDPRWSEQVALLRALAGTDVPVPALLGHEESDSPLGAPFMVMRRVEGRVPADLPSYHREGWLHELAPEDRRAAWMGAVEVLHRIHRLDAAALGVSGVPVGTARQLEEYAAHLPYYGPRDDALVSEALGWLRANLPDEHGDPRLLWGDARLGNIIYRGTAPAAVLDWEMAALGRPETDLAWFLYLDRFLSEGVGAPRLDGLPDRARTVAEYERLAGRAVEDLDYYLVFAGFRFCLITARVIRLLAAGGVIDADFPLHRNATALLATTLREAARHRSSPRASALQ
jgi:aminoglycoside phosphotransferase (APT) family kinase protein